jgi:hypothetical protein
MTARIHSLDRSGRIQSDLVDDQGESQLGSVRLGERGGYGGWVATTWREEVAMSVPHADDQGHRSPGESLEVPREELLARARPLPPHEDMVIGELTDEEAAAFWAAITQA